MVWRIVQTDPDDSRWRTLVDVVEQRARDSGARRAYMFLEHGEHEAETLTYAELAARARRIAAQLQAWGAVGERVLLLYPQGLGFIEAFCGSLYAGATPVPALPVRRGRALARLEGIARDAQPKIALTTPALLSKTRELLSTVAPDVRVESVAEVRDEEREQAWSAPAISGSDAAFLQYTSGSTGTPRGVVVTHANILHNQRFIKERLASSREDVWVSWLPMFHDMGLIGAVMQPLYTGAFCIVMSPEAFLQQPRRWPAAITRYRITISGGPNFAYDTCVQRIPPAERAGFDLSSLRIAFNGSEPVHAQTLERFADAYADCGFDRRAFFPCYGLAEATLMVTGARTGRAPVMLPVDAAELERNRIRPDALAGRRRLVSCGAPASDHRVLIVDPATRAPLPQGSVGEIWVAGPSVAAGYWQRPDETRETFRARLAQPADADFLRTGDLGGLVDEELYVTGRLKDLIIVRGQKHYSTDIERTVAESHPALQPGSAAAFMVDCDGSERVVVMCETRRESWNRVDADTVTAIVRERIAQEHGLGLERLVLMRPGSVPKTSSGKLRRQACRALYLAGLPETGDEDQALKAGMPRGGASTPA